MTTLDLLAAIACALFSATIVSGAIALAFLSALNIIVW